MEVSLMFLAVLILLTTNTHTTHAHAQSFMPSDFTFIFTSEMSELEIDFQCLDWSGVVIRWFDVIINTRTIRKSNGFSLLLSPILIGFPTFDRSIERPWIIKTVWVARESENPPFKRVELYWTCKEPMYIFIPHVHEIYRKWNDNVRPK